MVLFLVLLFPLAPLEKISANGLARSLLYFNNKTKISNRRAAKVFIKSFAALTKTRPCHV